MKILSIAKMIILRSLRNVNIMLIMCAMPLVIIFVLGLAFDSQIGKDADIALNDMHITYSLIGEKTELSDGIEYMMDELLSEESTYTMVEDKQAQLEKLKAASITAHIEINEQTQSITLYKNNRINTSSSIVESALQSFAARYNTIVEIAKINPMIVSEVLANDGETHYIDKIGLSEDYQPSAMDYYGVAMVALFVLYGFLTPLEEVIEDRNEGLVRRISTTSVKPIERFIGSVVGYVSVSIIRSGIVIIISWLVYGVNWGTVPVYPFSLLFALTVTMTALGMMLAEMFKSSNSAGSVGHIFIVVSAFFGGAYLSLEDMGPIAEVGKYFSLIWWTNTGIANQIYNNDFSYMKTAFLIFAILSTTFLAVSIILMNRREAYSNEQSV